MTETEQLQLILDNAPYSPIAPNFIADGYGSDAEPRSSIWCGCLTRGLGEYYKEGLVVFDYGCGAGRLCNFLSKRLKDFKYYGVEPSGGNQQWGEKSIEKARSFFGHDSRVTLGTIGSEVEKEALQKANAVVLGSIFTHLTYDSFCKVNDKFLPLLDRGGCVVFSVFIRDHYLEDRPGAHGFDNFYDHCFYTQEQVNSYCEQRRVQMINTGCFDKGSPWEHLILRITK